MKLIYLAVLGVAFVYGTTVVSADDKKPNIVFILADDFGYGDLKCYGHPYALTPNLDKLATEGTRFTQCYMTGVTCCPSRTGLMTSKFPATFKEYPASYGFGKQITITELLKKEGYVTGHFGKWHIGPATKAGTYGIDNINVADDDGKVRPKADERGRDAHIFDDAIQFIEKNNNYGTHLAIRSPEEPATLGLLRRWYRDNPRAIEWNRMVIDGEVRSDTLFGMVRKTHALNPQGTIVAYSDNAAVMEGHRIERWQSAPAGGSVYAARDELAHVLMKVETHNHPTAISPFPGASTGAGGEIRDEGATGRGAKPKAGLTGFSVSNLNLPGTNEPWEQEKFGKPSHIASALQIMIDGPLGGAALWDGLPRLHLTGALALGYVVAFCTVGTYVLNAYALKRAPASLVATYIYLQPVLGTILAAALLHERPGLETLASGGLILAGLWLVTRG